MLLTDDLIRELHRLADKSRDPGDQAIMRQAATKIANLRDENVKMSWERD